MDEDSLGSLGNGSDFLLVCHERFEGGLLEGSEFVGGDFIFDP
jgi:hypothetical protein